MTPNDIKFSFSGGFYQEWTVTFQKPWTLIIHRLGWSCSCFKVSFVGLASWLNFPFVTWVFQWFEVIFVHLKISLDSQFRTWLLSK
jgi:hypothetical protein